MKAMYQVKKAPEIDGHDDLKKIRKQCRNWTAEEWELYLKTLEVQRQESLISDQDVEEELFPFNVFDLIGVAAPLDASKAVTNLMSVLTERQRLVIEKIFWKGHTEKKISEDLFTSKSNIYDLKRRAILKMQKRAAEVLGAHPIVRAKVISID